MKKILHIISSPRGDASFSIKLANVIIEKLVAAYPNSTVKVNDLNKNMFPHLGKEHLEAFFTRPENRTAQHLADIAVSQKAIKEIAEANIIVIGVPVYNFNIHSSLKAWIDHIVRGGITFQIGENGPEGLVNGKKVYLAISSKGIYSAGPLKSPDFVEPYLRFILQFIGIVDVEVFRLEGSSVPEEQQAALEKLAETISIA